MSKKLFAIQVVETMSRTIVIESEDEDRALDIVNEMYDNAEIMLDYDDFSDKEIYTLEIFDDENNRLTRKEIENIYGDIIIDDNVSQSETV